MNEDFLHYAWKFQKFSRRELITVSGQLLRIQKVGTHNFNAGPDFLCSQIVLNNQVWAGNVEIHVQSSHWYTHRHETDVQYDNVILHVVWEHDMEVRRSDESIIPTLALKDLIDRQILINYRKLFASKQRWINCENDLNGIDPFVMNRWLHRLFIERVEEKAALVVSRLERSQNNWEAVLFQLLCKNFGLKVNGSSFLSIADSLPYKVVRNCAHKEKEMEALLLGQASLLSEDKSDPYYLQLQEVYVFLKNKFKIEEASVIPKFFRLRPPNFPTIRLSQLAMLLVQHKNLFSEIISAKNLKDYYQIFNVAASAYWERHYNFGVTSAKSPKKLSKRFVELLLINTVIPIKYCYAKVQGLAISEELIEMAMTMRAEDNTVVKQFRTLKEFENSALSSQALLQLKNRYCDLNRCLHCEVGNHLLKR